MKGVGPWSRKRLPRNELRMTAQRVSKESGRKDPNEFVEQSNGPRSKRNPLAHWELLLYVITAIVYDRVREARAGRERNITLYHGGVVLKHIVRESQIWSI